MTTTLGEAVAATAAPKKMRRWTAPDIGKLATTFHHGGEAECFNAFPDMDPKVVRAKLVELNYVQKPEPPALDPMTTHWVDGIAAELARIQNPKQRELAARALIKTAGKHVSVRVRTTPAKVVTN